MKYEAIDEQDDDIQESPEDIIWCLHCERTYRRKEAKTIFVWGHPLEVCPHDGCDGSLPIDGWDWENVRRGREDRYPAEPEPGKVYPLYE